MMQDKQDISVGKQGARQSDYICIWINLIFHVLFLKWGIKYIINSIPHVDIIMLLAPLVGLGLDTNEFRVERCKRHQGVDTSAPKGDLHFLGHIYHFSALMCLHLGTVCTKFICT